MTAASGNVDEQKVFREKLKRHRGSYFVTYMPADARFPFAIIQVTFPQMGVDTAIVKRAMEQELGSWLKQFPVPAMVSAFDAREDLIHVSNRDGESHLTGYVNQQTGQVVKCWGLLDNNKLPSEQMETGYLTRIYEGLPFRRQEDVRLEAYRKARSSGRAIRFIVFLVVGVPLLIEIISLGIDWVGYLLSGISISIGLYKLGKAMGWVKPSQREKLEAEKNNKMGHYYYHWEIGRAHV